MLTEYEFDSRAAASTATAARMAGLIGDALQRSERAAFVVSGGSTPRQSFELLSDYDLPWERAQVLLSDERWVSAEHSDSNERLLYESLLINQAKKASLLSLYQSGVTPDERCAMLRASRPETDFACSLVGMGADGHFASLFPDAIDLDAGLDIKNEDFYLPIRTAASPHERLSITLAALLRSAEILLLFFGDDKRAVYEAAKASDSQTPIAALLQRSTVPISVFWAP